MRWPVLALALAWEAASFGPQEHASAAREAIVRARTLQDACAEADRAHAEAGKDPLVAASDPRPVYKQYLLALRHLMAVLAGKPGAEGLDAFLARAGEFDAELSQLTALGKAEPYYYWHGPKRHVPAKWAELLGHKVGGEEVGSLLSTPAGALRGETASGPPELPSLGLVFPKAASKADLLSTAALRVSEPGADACAASAAAKKEGIGHLILGGPEAAEHLKPCLDPKLRITWDLSSSFDSLFTSDSNTPMQDAVDEALSGSKRKSLDVLGLPLKAFTDKRLKGYVAASVKEFLESKKVKEVALVGPVPSKTLEKILGGPLKPRSWITQHDDCAHVTPRLLELSEKTGLKVISHGTPCGAVLASIAAKEGVSDAALLSRWTAELGMAVALPHGQSDAAGVLKAAQAAKPLSQESWRLLSGTATLSRAAALAVSPDTEDTFGLRKLIARASELAKKELALAGKPSAGGTLRPDLWADIEEDKKAFVKNDFIIYKDNFLSPETYKKVQDEADRLWKSPELEPNCNLNGVDRVGGYVSDALLANTSLYAAFYGSEEFRQWISRINGHLMFPSDFPLELREYPSGSAGMQCHRDLLMYTNATLDMEFVYTIDNHGTCITTYENREGEVTEVHTQPNSLIMVRPNAAMHCVKESKGGHRTMLKFIYVGDFRKSSEFGFYMANECGDENPNRKVLQERRERLQTMEL